ncbi:16S rRNA (guanine(527)-N(7))-methyltransferase RsmG [Sphingomonas sp. 8AM]|uniref:16S rRNA (guanine(527)-N(7))-methyltransferase RsmG n=1 Tax=Sphingomonas sp. 8AM TaxID=2653170 RepID=UPI0012F113F3|nr:16S rRNA (guanine(527)-N(7))-methyltransferase RsmG [Sphingomonas sp. 8AM]VXC94580.1 Ribosomal RNA small subunit methyltransferase G [Sphingomonas sp. 8AM]
MTEDDSVAWCHATFGEDAVAKLDHFRALLLEENQHQNLISPASTNAIWNRHIADSAQLAQHIPANATTWFDIGSGPGLPGLVIAILCDLAVTLVEPRGRRVEFLAAAANELNLGNVVVHKAKAETVTGDADIISARAVASIPDLIAMTSHLRHSRTRMILPRGQNGGSEVEMLPARWRGMFHVEQSVTDPASVIVIGDGVRT